MMITLYSLNRGRQEYIGDSPCLDLFRIQALAASCRITFIAAAQILLDHTFTVVENENYRLYLIS